MGLQCDGNRSRRLRGASVPWSPPIWLACSALALLPVDAPAQAIRRSTLAPQLEARAEFVASPRIAAHAGVGVNLRAGAYARIGVAYLAGVADVADVGARFSHRADATVRFLLDPFAEQRHGLYAGGGLTVRQVDGASPEGRLMLLIGVEGDPKGRVVPAVELALGDGVRVGVVLRARRTGGAASR